MKITSAGQPGWPVPVVAPSSGIVQLARFDFVHQYTPTHTFTETYGNSKGFNFIPYYRTEVDTNLPPLSINAQVQGVGTTGSYKIGTLRNQINPTVIAGRGFGRFDVQSSIGGVLPVGSVHTVGRNVVWNTVGQYRATNLLWPEVEVNSTFYHLGPNDGKNQTFLTPGMMTSRIPLTRDKTNRLGVIVGAGMQIATSGFHGYNRALVISCRITF